MPGALPGYFGKVLTHGDFVRARLAPDFVAPWDAWLQAGLRHSRQALGPGWLDLYLNSPLWRFALGAGVCGPAAMAGVLLPGVDRVGRHFPLTLALPMAGDAAPWTELFGGAAPWFDALESQALDCLAPGFSLAGLDDGLARLAQTGRPPACAVPLAGRCLFWTGMAASSMPVLKVFDRLPDGEGFFGLLAGH